MANHRLWAPWRLEYVKDASKDSECIFCSKPAEGDDERAFIVHRGGLCYVILNTFPYTNGHVMVAPFDHVARLQDLGPEAAAEMTALAQRSMAVLDAVYAPDGYNLGLNQGRIAGAGFEGHVHFHVVPRWAGDTNFMPVLGDVRVMPQSLDDSYAALAGKF